MADAAPAKKTGKPVVVQCDGIKLKLTCTKGLLEKPFSDCILTPYLGVFNKKRGTNYVFSDLKKVEVHDGGLTLNITNLSAPGSRCVGDADNPIVTIHLPKAEASAASTAADALLATHPQASVEIKRDALRALRLAGKDALPTIKPLLSPELIACVAQHACLLSSETERTHAWDAAAAEAAVLLHKTLIAADHAAVGALLSDEKLGVVPRLAAVFADACKQPLTRLRFLSPIAFVLSLQPSVSGGTHSASFAAAVRSALAWICEALEVPDALDESLASEAAGDLVRCTFNLLRAKPPDASKEEGRKIIDSLLHSLKLLLQCPSKAAALQQTQLSALQLPLALPEPIAFKELSSSWQPLCALLHPLLLAYNEDPSDDSGNATVVPLMVLQKICENDAEARDEIKAHIFGSAVTNRDAHPAGQDPYQPAGTDGWDPNEKLPTDTSLKMLLLKMLTATSFNAKHVTGNMLFAVCNDNAEDFAYLCGLGSAAGLLSERGLFQSFQQQANVVDERDDDDDDDAPVDLGEVV